MVLLSEEEVGMLIVLNSLGYLFRIIDAPIASSVAGPTVEIR